MQAFVDWVLIIFGTQVINKKPPVRPVYPDYFPFLMTLPKFTLAQADRWKMDFDVSAPNVAGATSIFKLDFRKCRLSHNLTTLLITVKTTETKCTEPNLEMETAVLGGLPTSTIP